jgi:hypothetical protein
MLKRGRVVTLLFILTVCFNLVGLAAADQIPVEKIEVSTPVYRPVYSEFEPLLGTYTYKVSWQGIPAATVTISVERDGLRYRLETTAKTYKAIDLFYRLRYQAQGLISAVDYLPLRSSFDTKENSRHKHAVITFLPDGTIHSVYKRKGREAREVEFNTNNFTLDPFSAAFLARSLKWEKGITRQFDTYNGRSRYLISLTAVEKVKMRVNNKIRDVWVVSPTVKKLNSSRKKNKLREAKIYVTADNRKEILQIISEVFIGSVKTKLISFVPSNRPITGTAVASGRKHKVFIK